MQSTDTLETRNIWLKQYILLNNKDLDNKLLQQFIHIFLLHSSHDKFIELI